MAYRVYVDDPVYKLDERRFETIEEANIAAQLISKSTSNNTMTYDVDEKERIDLLFPMAVFINGEKYLPVQLPT
jgi:hypothetical protein